MRRVNWKRCFVTPSRESTNSGNGLHLRMVRGRLRFPRAASRGYDEVGSGWPRVLKRFAADYGEHRDGGRLHPSEAERGDGADPGEREQGHGAPDDRAVSSHGIVGWRRGQKLFGKPDFGFRRERVAAFVDGCSWHGCPKPKHSPLPKNNADWWAAKLGRNRERDLLVTRTLRKAAGAWCGCGNAT